MIDHALGLSGRCALIWCEGNVAPCRVQAQSAIDEGKYRKQAQGADYGSRASTHRSSCFSDEGFWTKRPKQSSNDGGMSIAIVTCPISPLKHSGSRTGCLVRVCPSVYTISRMALGCIHSIRTPFMAKSPRGDQTGKLSYGQ